MRPVSRTEGIWSDWRNESHTAKSRLFLRFCKRFMNRQRRIHAKKYIEEEFVRE